MVWKWVNEIVIHPGKHRLIQHKSFLSEPMKDFCLASLHDTLIWGQFRKRLLNSTRPWVFKLPPTPFLNYFLSLSDPSLFHLKYLRGSWDFRDNYGFWKVPASFSHLCIFLSVPSTYGFPGKLPWSTILMGKFANHAMLRYSLQGLLSFKRGSLLFQTSLNDN